MTTLTGLDPQDENRRQQRILAVADRKFSNVLTGVLRAAYDQMLAEYMATGSPPAMPDNLTSRLEQVYTDMAAVMISAFGGRVLAQGKASGVNLETKGFAEFFQRMALEYVASEAIRRRITGVAETTRNIIISNISQGQENGLGVADIGLNLNRLIPALSRIRANLIARTETHGAANFGADQAARATGLNLRKEWVAAEDARTRDFGEGDGVIDEFSHRAADGQVVDMDQPFRIRRKNGTTEALMFPGDPNGSPGNTINCRCSVSHIVDDF